MIKLFQKHLRTLTTIIIILLFTASLWQLATASWIQGKAMIAQQLLNHSWDKTINAISKDSNPAVYKPWPWADTWPVAKLRVPQHNIEQIILAGDNGNSLAFGPGYSFASAAPNTSGGTIISGHRDTHFSFLKKLKLNDTVFIQTSDKTVRYRVYDFQIVDSKTFNLQTYIDEQTLVFVTCYPFETINTGGSLRYLVYATRQTT